MSGNGNLPKFRRYRVRRGDSLWKIAEHAYGHGNLWEGISDANHLKRGRPIFAGQELFIPIARHSTHPNLHRSLAGTQVTPPQRHADPGPPVPLQHLGTHNRDASTRTGPFQPSRPVLFPQFKYELNGIVAEYVTPKVDYKLSFTGEVTMQKEGVITGGLTFTKDGIEAEYKKEADGVFNTLFSKSIMKTENGKAEVSLAVGSTLKSGNQVLATTETSVVPPNGIKYTYKGQEIKGTFQGYEFAGVMGYELVLRYKPDPPENHAVQVTQWTRVEGILALVAVAVIVLVEVPKDVGSLGLGFSESPASFAAAAALFGVGMAKLRGPKHTRGDGRS